MNAARLGSELFQGYATRLELVAMGGLDIPAEELLGQTQTPRKVEDYIRVGARRAGSGHDGLAELNQRLCFRANFETDLQCLVFEARRNGQNYVGQAAVGFMNKSACA
jgi:hypothetical protein